LILSVQLAAAASVKNELHITVRLRNYADLPRARLIAAERGATRIFHQAGIATEWLDCSKPPVATNLHSRCEAPAGPVEVSIEVLQGETMEHLGLQHTTLGVAVLPAKLESGETFANDALVCLRCVNELAIAQGEGQESESLKSTILASVLAHELGHLLGIRAHSVFGVMHTPWDRRDLTMAEQGRLLFTAGETRAIQAQVRKRQMAACVPRNTHALATFNLAE
jgi:hypothetical protein